MGLFDEQIQPQRQDMSFILTGMDGHGGPIYHFHSPGCLELCQDTGGAICAHGGSCFSFYSIADFVFSIISIRSFREKIAYLYSEYFNLSNAEIEKILNSFKRLRTAFPNLSRYIDNNINEEIKSKIGFFLKTIPEKILPDMNGRRHLEKEFYEIIDDIYEHEEFLKLKEHYHHNSSIYEHVMDVSYFLTGPVNS